MLARKSDLVRLALSAAALACCSSASTRLRSVTSRAAAEAPCRVPLRAYKGGALQCPVPVVKGSRIVGYHRLLAVTGARRQLVVGDRLFAQHALDRCLGSF